MNQLSNRQRLTVYFIGFFLGCVVLSFWHEQRRSAKEEKGDSDSAVPGIISYYADMGIPLEGPFVLATGRSRNLDDGTFLRVVIIGSRDQNERFRVEEIYSGELGSTARLLHWRASDPDHVWVRLKDGADRTSVVGAASESGYNFIRYDRGQQAFLVRITGDDPEAVSRGIDTLLKLDGVGDVTAMILDQSENFPSVR